MRRFFIIFLTLLMLCTLTACGDSDTPENSSGGTPPDSAPAQADRDGDYTVYDCGGIAVALPSRYLDQLIVDTDFPDASDGWRPLISAYEKASVEAAQADWGGGGAGFLFGLIAMDQVGYERLLCENPAGMEVIAKDGERYYAHTFPTDVQFYRSEGIDMESEDWKNWETLNQMSSEVLADVIDRNGLTPYDRAEFFSRSFTWEGEHTCLKFYFESEGQPYILVLSQPVRQGEGGIWCVDRWMYADADPMVYFPDSGLPAAEYYAQLQEACDAGEHMELLTPAGAAAALVKDYFGLELPESDFQTLDAEEEARVMANLRLREIVTNIRTGQDVDGIDLLDCLGHVGLDNWAALGLGTFGLDDWWPPFLAALEEAAVGERQQERDWNLMAFYLTTQEGSGSQQSAVAAVLRKQRQADEEAFSAALADFSSEERAALEEAVGE